MADVGKTAAGRGQVLAGVVRAAHQAVAAGDEPGLIDAVGAAMPALLDQDLSGPERELAQVLASLGAVAAQRGARVEELAQSNAVKDLFAALAAGAGELAAARAAETDCDLGAPYLLISAVPAGGLAVGDARWQASADRLGLAFGRLSEHTAVAAGPGPVRALVCLRTPGHQEHLDEVVRDCRDVARAQGAVVGVAAPRFAADAAMVAFRESEDAARIGAALHREGGAVAYDELGAYRYLVGIEPGDAPHDRTRDAVDVLIAYDRRRRTQLLDTLERYLTERLSVIESARQLYIHPNTLRQRLARIEELTGLALESEDLLSVELAIKLARLHGRDTRPGS